MSRLLISAAHKSSGKTTLGIGLCAAFQARGLKIQPFKKGPDYIDPLWLREAAKRCCHNLDFQTQSGEEIKTLFARRMEGADIGLIEGNKGLYDGLDLDGGNSNAALAELLEAPVVLIIDTRGMTRGIAPLLLGYRAFGPNIRIGGVILNFVGGRRHEMKLRQVVEHYTDLPVMGAVHRSTDIGIAERHLGLTPSNEARDRNETVRIIGERVAEQVALDRLLELAATAPTLKTPPRKTAPPAKKDLRIGIPRDSAFGFYYQGDLEALEAAGAELVFFNTLTDSELPPVEGLFIGGGFPETQMEALEGNRSLRQDIRRFVESGGPVYAECGGLIYLARTLNWRGKCCEMVGAIAADAVMHDSPQGKGYVRLRETGKNPWPASGAMETIHGHEFHYSSLQNLPGKTRFAYEVLRGTGVDGRNDGIVYKNLLASYSHLRDTEGLRWARRFVDHVRSCIKEHS